MNSGLLRTPITVYTRASAKDENGYQVPMDTLVCAVRAEVMTTSAREIWEGYAAKVRSIVNFGIRPRQDVRSGMWVQCKGQWYEILDIQPPIQRKGKMILKTTWKGAV